MVLGMNSMWLLMASDGQFCAKGVEVAVKILKFKFHAPAMGKQALNIISRKLKEWT